MQVKKHNAAAKKNGSKVAKSAKKTKDATKKAKKAKKEPKGLKGLSIHSLNQFTGGARPKSLGKHGVPKGMGIEASWCWVFMLNAKRKENQKWDEAMITKIMLDNFPKRECKVFQSPSSARFKYNNGKYPLGRYDIAVDTKKSKEGQEFPKFESIAY